MKKITYISLLTIAFTWSACSDNEMLDSSPRPEGNFTVEATIDNGQPDARTHIFNISKQLWWTPGDEIGVYGTTGNNIKFFSVETTNKETASFSGSFPNNDTPVYAYYPYSATDGEGLSGEGNKTWNVTLPEKIEFARLEAASPSTLDRMGTNAPMIATSYDAGSNTFTFKHVCGLMQITIASIPTDAASLVITSEGENQNISGKCTIADITASSPQLTPPTSGSKTVTITLPQTETYGEKTFYIPLPVATYSKLTMELKEADGSIILQKSVSSLPVACGQLVDMNKLTGLELKPSEVKSVLATALANGGTVDILLKEITANDATIEFPTFAQGGNRTVNLLFAAIPTTKLTIKKAEGEGPSIGTLNVKLPGSETFNSEAWTETPAWTDVANAPGFDISLPGAKITLDSDNENKIAQYGEVSLSGGYSSYIGSTLKGNITINSLTIAAGTNINITGVIGKISIPAENSTTTQIFLNKGSNAPKRVGYCYEFENLSGRTITYKSSLPWDGTLKCKPLKDAGGQYLIRSAAELAYFQPAQAPTSSTAANMTATMDASAKLCCDINLNNEPWLGMILGENAVFDGGNHKISNVKIKNYVLSEESIYSKEACIGLFAATKPGSQIKDIEIDKFTSEETGLAAKWCGALVGYSRGTTLYSNCKVSKVTIKSNESNAYRIGGLIGFIDRVTGTDLPVTVEGCSATNVTITGAYSLGGLIGTIQGSAERTITNCSVTEPIKIEQNTASSALTGGFNYNPTTQKATYYAPKEYVGNVGKFIGDLACSITFSNMNESVTEFTAKELTAFGFGKIQVGNYTKDSVSEFTDTVKKEMKNEALRNATYVSLQDATTPFIPAQTANNITIVVNEKTLTTGTDFNRFTSIEVE